MTKSSQQHVIDTRRWLFLCLFFVKRSFHDEDRAFRLFDDVLADAAEQDALNDAESAAAHDDEVHVVARRKVENDDGWRSRLRECFLLDAGRNHLHRAVEDDIAGFRHSFEDGIRQAGVDGELIDVGDIEEIELGITCLCQGNSLRYGAIRTFRTIYWYQDIFIIVLPLNW